MAEPTADPCRTERDALERNAEEQREIRVKLEEPDLPASIVEELERRLAQLRLRARGLAEELRRCEAAHSIPVATLRSEFAFDAPVRAVAITRVSARTAVAAVGNQLTVFDADNGEFIRNRAIPGVMGAPIVGPAGEYFVVGSSDRVLRAFDMDGDDLWRATHASVISATAMSPQTGNLVATGTEAGEKKVRVFTRDVPTGGNPLAHAPVWERQQPATVVAVAVSPDDRVIAVACQDRTVQLLNASDGNRIGEPLPHDARIRQLCVSPTGTTLAVALADGNLRLIDIAAVAAGPDLPHPAPLTDVSFSSDGALIATATAEPDGKVRVWNVAVSDRESVYTFGAGAAVAAITFSPSESSRLAIAPGTAAAFVVDPATRVIKLLLPDTVTVMSYSPDGRMLMVGAGHTAKVLNVRGPAGPQGHQTEVVDYAR